MRTYLLTLLLVLTAVRLDAAGVIRVPDDADLQTAIALVEEGGVIEIATGTYTAPAGGWSISNANKSFTIRAEAGGGVTLSGGGNRLVLRYTNSLPSDYSVVFERLTFADGFSNQNGRGGGVTLTYAHATFVDCEFLDNAATPSNTGGGAVFMFNDSVAHFLGCRFEGNVAKNEGGALRVGQGSRAYVLRSEFVGNRTNIPDHRTSATGGAIHATNALLQVSNSRFEGNRGGCNAGAIYGIGTWTAPVSVPVTEMVIANSTFVDNVVEPDASVTCSFQPSGGAVHAENQTRLRIYNSRFFENRAYSGGAVTSYRSIVEIEGSLFRGNRATGTGSSSGFGGAIMSNSNDAVDSTTGSGTINRPSARLTVRGSLFQGRYGAVAESGIRGGCIFVNGDASRTFGIGSVPQMGDAATNRARVEIASSVFFDCDVAQDPTSGGAGAGGALWIGHADLTLESSLVVRSDAAGPTSAAGALRIATDSAATVTGTTFAHNTAGSRAGAIQVLGSVLDVDDCQFFGNELTSGSSGSAIWSRTLKNFYGVDIGTGGVVKNSVFSAGLGRYIQELDDAAGPINDLRYDGNLFFTEPVDSQVFASSIAGSHTAAALNSLVVTRNPGVGNTDKSTVANVALTAQPELGAILAAPAEILLSHAAADPPPAAESSLVYACSAAAGTAVKLFGLPAPGTSGLEMAGAGVHDLEVGAETFSTAIDNAGVPDAELAASPGSISGAESADLEWWTPGGTFLDVSIDRQVAIGSPAPTGTETVSPAATTSYRLYVLTREGGIEDLSTVYVGELAGAIFSDGFESGDTSAWSATSP